MASSSSHRSPNSSKWVNFDETTTTSPAKKSRKSSSFSSDAWTLNESMDDIERQICQQRNAMVLMSKQMEDIEVVLSNARGQLSKSKKLQTRSRLSLSLRKKNTRYHSMADEHDNDENDNNDEETCAVSNHRHKKSQKHSVLGILPRESSPSKRRETGSFPIHSSSRPQALVPPSQVSTRNSSRVAFPIPATSNSYTNHNNNPKDFNSSFTWDESEDDSNSQQSEEEDYEKQKSRNKILKLFLAFLAIVLVVAIGFLLGQWAQQVQRSKDAQQAQQQQAQQQQTPTPTVSPVILVPTNAGSDQGTIEEESYDNPGITEEMGEKEEEENLPWKDPIDEAPTSKPISIEESNDLDEENQVLGYDYTANTDFLVGVYYYPWHNANFHNGDGYMRRELEPKHLPALGEYNDSDPGIIAHHMKWFRQANIGLLVTSWWGPNRHEDKVTKDVIMEHEDVGNLKIALHYETTGRIGKQGEKLTNAMPDIKYMCENYFDHPNYYKIDGRPVLFIYISRVLDSIGILEEALLTMRSTASKCGHNLYLIGDSVFDSAPDANVPHFPFWYFDAVTNYDVYGSSGRPQGHAGTNAVDKYYRDQTQWKTQALREDCRYVPAVSPGYNDRGVRMERDHPPLSRRITSTSQEGSLFHYQLKQAKKLVDENVDRMILVNSFNEWHEDTQIEPVVGDPAKEPFNFTKGLEYVGYGELYLDILGAATSKDKTQHTKYDYLF